MRRERPNTNPGNRRSSPGPRQTVVRATTSLLREIVGGRVSEVAGVLLLACRPLPSREGFQLIVGERRSRIAALPIGKHAHGHHTRVTHVETGRGVDRVGRIERYPPDVVDFENPGARISEKGVLRTHRGCWFGAGCQGRDRPPSGPAVSAVGQAATRSSSSSRTRILVNELRMKATTVRLNEPRPT